MNDQHSPGITPLFGRVRDGELAFAEAIVIAGETDEEIGVQALLKPAAGFARTSGDVGTAGKSLSARADVMRSSHGVARRAWKVAVLSVM
jgi:hypothetical protein